MTTRDAGFSRAHCSNMAGRWNYLCGSDADRFATATGLSALPLVAMVHSLRTDTHLPAKSSIPVASQKMGRRSPFELSTVFVEYGEDRSRWGVHSQGGQEGGHARRV